MKHYGLIGKHLTHSLSAEYFTRKFAQEHIDADYQLIEMKGLWEGVPSYLDGYNVTIPYKRGIIPYLKSIDAVAAEIGAVNVVKDGIGYNTDWIGFKQAISEHIAAINDRPALILGQGGAANAVHYALKVMGIVNDMVSAHDDIRADVRHYGLIVNATPLGMYPNIDTYPYINYELLTPNQVLFDCVYNPEETEFLRRGKEQGATCVSGLAMLYAQAEAAWKIWNGE